LRQPRTHPRINDENQLIDPWGTPYDVHIETNSEVFSRSAEPNQETLIDGDVILEIEWLY